MLISVPSAACVKEMGTWQTMSLLWRSKNSSFFDIDENIQVAGRAAAIPGFSLSAQLQLHAGFNPGGNFYQQVSFPAALCRYRGIGGMVWL